MTRMLARRGVTVSAVVLAAGVSGLFVGPAFAESLNQPSRAVGPGTGRVVAQGNACSFDDWSCKCEQLQAVQKQYAPEIEAPPEACRLAEAS
jgi:hypothetical protein